MSNQILGRVIRLRYFVVVFLLALGLLAMPAAGQSSARVVAVGDIHGDYDAFVAILQQAGLVDSTLHWSGQNATLVQTGDMLDRGSKCREVMDLLMRLEKEAPRTGGRVEVLLGNHEAMNIMGDLRYAMAMYPSFADQNSERRRKSAFEAYAAWKRSRAAQGLLPAGDSPMVDEGAWMSAHPLGYIEQREAMSEDGKYGKWLRQRPAVAKIGNTLFVHGGISPDLAGWSAEKIVERGHTELDLFDHLMRVFARQKTVLPNFNLDEATIAVKTEFDAWNTKLGGKPSAIEEEQKKIEDLRNFLGYGGWFIVNPAGPLWFRGYAQWNDEEGKEKIAKVLASLGVSQIVVGHTPQTGGRIVSRFDGKVFLIDTGMLSSYFTGGRASALEIAAGKYTAVYGDQRIVLVDTTAHRGEASVPAGPDADGEIPGGGIEEQQAATPQQQPQAAAAAPAAAPAYHTWYDPDGKPLPFKSDAEVIEFMKNAKVTGKMVGTAKGITHPREVMLEKDGVRMHAFWRTYSEEKPIATLASGERELNFRDDFIFEPAAYELAVLLGMDNVPPTIVRTINGEKGSLQIGVEGVFDEGKRQKDKIMPPNPKQWNHQIQTMKMFDNLIYNTDRNMGNILIDKDWKVWLIDHSRAFRSRDDLNNKAALVEIDRVVWEHLKTLDDNNLKTHLKPYLRGYEVDAVIKRKKKIIEAYNAEIAKRGEADVVKDMPQ